MKSIRIKDANLTIRFLRWYPIEGALGGWLLTPGLSVPTCLSLNVYLQADYYKA
jgi:hypothetical protein